MKFIHHNTGEWIRSDCNTSATRTKGFVREYPSIEAIDDKWLKQQFEWMMEIGEIVTSSGSDVFQIRRG